MFRERSFEKQGTTDWHMNHAGNVQWIILVHLVFFLGVFFWRAHVIGTSEGQPIARALGISKDAIRGDLEIWRMFMYMWFHNNIILFVTNMMGLWMVGSFLENYWNFRKLLLFYAGAGTFAGLCSFLFAQPAALIGATGAVIGGFTACFYLCPEKKLLNLIELRYGAWIAIAFLTVLHSLLMFPGERIQNDPTAAVAQLGGILFGWMYFTGTPWINRMYRRWEKWHRKKMKRKRTHMRVRVERLLKKISNEGYDQLTWKEKSFLKRASRVYRKADEAEKQEGNKQDSNEEDLSQ